MWDIHPLFFPFVSLSLNVKPNTHGHTQAPTFKGVAVLHCWNVLRVCNSYCMSDLPH